MKTIKYYVKSNYGVPMEYIHPDSVGDAKIIQQLTGKKTVTGVVRELIRDLSGGTIRFEQVLPVS